MKRFFSALCSAVIALSVLFVFYPSSVGAAFDANRIIDDSVYNNTGSMNAAQIDSWLNAYFPSSCISTNSGFEARIPSGYTPSGGFTFGDFTSAGQVIATGAQVYGLNPQVLLVTLEKEQSLVGGRNDFAGYCNNGIEHKYAAATGYGCPDGGSVYSWSGVSLYRRSGVERTSTGQTCVNSSAKAGFSQQVIRAAWLLKFGQQRSLGNTGWDVQIPPNWDNSDDPQTCYGGPMTQGYRKRCSSDVNPVYYDGYTTIDGSSTHMGTGATAALYWYTPHFNGNQNFYNLFLSWFGDPTTACISVGNLSSTPSGPRIISYNQGQTGLTNLTFTLLNNTGSTCAEAHVWNPGFTSWLTNIATGMRATDPRTGMLVASRSKVDNRVSLNYVMYSGAGGAVEVHRFGPNLQRLPGYYDVASNLTGVTSSNGTFVAGDFFGVGYDQLAYILYSGNNGAMEVHMFDQTMTRAVGFYDLPTDIGAVNNGVFVAGDFLGRGYAQLAYVSYGNTEVHLLDIRGGSAKRIYEVPTNLTGTSSTTGTFVAGDFLGRGYAQLVYVIYSNGTNRVETHMFNPSLTQATGFQDIITNLGGFNPSQ